MSIFRSAPIPEFDDEVERRFRREIEAGSVQGDTFVTRSGARVPMLLPGWDDDHIVSDSCVWCDGRGTGGDARGYDGLCDACRGTGRGGKTTKGTQRKQGFLDMLFFTDAPRFEKMDRDICPDCGGGGCGGECHWTPEEWAREYANG